MPRPAFMNCLTPLGETSFLDTNFLVARLKSSNTNCSTADRNYVPQTARPALILLLIFMTVVSFLQNRFLAGRLRSGAADSARTNNELGAPNGATGSNFAVDLHDCSLLSSESLPGWQAKKLYCKRCSNENELGAPNAATGSDFAVDLHDCSLLSSESLPGWQAKKLGCGRCSNENELGAPNGATGSNFAVDLHDGVSFHKLQVLAGRQGPRLYNISKLWFLRRNPPRQTTYYQSVKAGYVPAFNRLSFSISVQIQIFIFIPDFQNLAKCFLQTNGLGLN